MHEVGRLLSFVSLCRILTILRRQRSQRLDRGVNGAANAAASSSSNASTSNAAADLNAGRSYDDAFVSSSSTSSLMIVCVRSEQDVDARTVSVSEIARLFDIE